MKAWKQYTTDDTVHGAGHFFTWWSLACLLKEVGVLQLLTSSAGHANINKMTCVNVRGYGVPMTNLVAAFVIIYFDVYSYAFFLCADLSPNFHNCSLINKPWLTVPQGRLRAAGRPNNLQSGAAGARGRGERHAQGDEEGQDLLHPVWRYVRCLEIAVTENVVLLVNTIRMLLECKVEISSSHHRK